MSLTPGARLGPYEVTAQIGVGGMGEVYLATDTNLKRQVAIKVLPASVAGDAERLARFQREAEVLAALNHPHIAAIYGLEKTPEFTALVMELVEGEDLSQRIARGAIPVDEALPIAKQIAEALEAAHEQGIIHRDLKPANIKVRSDGTVKVLDFGLAKAMEPAAGSSPSVSMSPTITTPAMTQAGMILGTAAYMSPEQARGRAVDKRADIWAFGAVLHEMLTGTRAFGGEDVAETLANVINRDPAWDTLPAGLPAHVRQTLRLCLKKPLRERVPDIGTVRLMLDGAFDAEVVGGARDGLAVPMVQRPGRGVAAAMASALLAALVVGGSAWWLWPTPTPPRPLRFALDLPPLSQIARSRVALSPDGQMLAYAATEGLYVRALGELIPRLIPGSEGQVLEPAFSPDGRTLVYLHGSSQGAQIRRVAVSGGPSTVVASELRSLRGFPWGLSWGWDDMILLGAPGGVFAVPAGGGGEPRQIVTTMSRATAPQRLPGTTAVLYTAIGDDGSGAVVIQEPGSAEGVTVLKDAFGARYVATGHLVYVAGDQVLAVPFDVERRAVTGTPVPVGQGGVFYSGTASRPELPNIAAADTGAVAIVTGARPTRTLVWVDRAGREEALPVPPRDYVYAQLSPDGRRIALDSRDQDSDIWVFDLMREALSRLTFDKGRNRGVAWSPDGRRVAFSRTLDDGTEDVWWQNADGSGMPEPLTATRLGSGDRGLMPSAFTPDGKRLLYESGGNPRDIGIVDVGNPASAHFILNAQPNEYAADVSPDGRYLVYNSNESGVLEVYVRPLQDPDAARWQISNGGGTRPRWSPTGKELFYLASDTERGPTAVMAVPVTLGGTFTAGRPTMVIRGDYAVPQNSRQVYDVTRDGQRFLMFKEGTTAAQLLYIQN